MTVALCCDDAESGNRIARQLSGLCGVITTVSFYNISDFLAMVTDNPNVIMLIAQTGALSTETAMAAREHNPQGKLIWFSDLDFALLSFRLKATYFGLLPIEDEKLRVALDYCGITLTDEKNNKI